MREPKYGEIPEMTSITMMITFHLPSPMPTKVSIAVRSRMEKPQKHHRHTMRYIMHAYPVPALKSSWIQRDAASVWKSETVKDFGCPSQLLSLVLRMMVVHLILHFPFPSAQVTPVLTRQSSRPCCWSPVLRKGDIAVCTSLAAVTRHRSTEAKYPLPPSTSPHVTVD